MIAVKKCLALLIAIPLLIGCSVAPVETEPPKITIAPTTMLETEPLTTTAPVTTPPTTNSSPTRKIAGYLPNGEPVYEDQIVVPEPYYFDEYGARYILVDDNATEYCMDEDYVEVLPTPDSTAFVEIAYHHYHGTLSVVFRTSGVGYYYYNVERDIWYQFKNADSKGEFFNEYIRGFFEYDRD